VEQLELLLGLESLAPNERWEFLLSYILNQVAKVLGLDSSSLPKSQERLFEIGLNSLGTVELMTRLGTSLGKFLSPTLIFDYPTVEALAAYLTEELLPDLGLKIAVRGIVNSVSDKVGSFTSEHENTTLAQLAEYSEEETEALLIKKLEGIEENL
jgi:acyl carrier protein